MKTFPSTVAIIGDSFFIANRRRTAQIWTDAGLPVYTYRFDTLTNTSLPNAFFGVYHTTEIALVLHNTEGVGYVTGDPFGGKPASYLALADYMSHAWIGEDLSPVALKYPTLMDRATVRRIHRERGSQFVAERGPDGLAGVW